MKRRINENSSGLYDEFSQMKIVPLSQKSLFRFGICPAIYVLPCHEKHIGTPLLHFGVDPAVLGLVPRDHIAGPP